MGFTVNWENNNDWDLTTCPEGWDLNTNDKLKFLGVWEGNNLSVEIQRIRTGEPEPTTWAANCTFVSENEQEKITGTAIEVDQAFTITHSVGLDGKSHLTCVATDAFSSLILSTPPKAKGGGGGAIGRFLARYVLRPLAKGFHKAGKCLDKWANLIGGDEPNGGRPGSWVAEEGGTNAPRIVPYDRSYARRRA